MGRIATPGSRLATISSSGCTWVCQSPGTITPVLEVVDLEASGSKWASLHINHRKATQMNRSPAFCKSLAVLLLPVVSDATSPGSTGSQGVSLAARLDPSRFVRVHRSATVNIQSIVRLKPASHGEFDVLLKDGGQTRVSRTYRGALERSLGQSL